MDAVYYKIVPAGEEALRPAEDWRRSVLDKLVCKHCGNILHEHRSNPVDVQLEWDGYPQYLVPLLYYTIPMIIIRTDLYEALSADLVGWPVGRVFFQDSEPGGAHFLQPDTGLGYRSLIAPTDCRCRLCYIDNSVFQPCHECGRQLGSSPDNDEWLDVKNVANQPAVTSMYGDRLILSLNTILRIPSVLRSMINISIVTVKACQF
jgi:hypothetical protein